MFFSHHSKNVKKAKKLEKNDPDFNIPSNPPKHEDERCVLQM